MQTITRPLAIILYFLALASEFASGDDAVSRAKAIAPFIEAQTIAVARVDLSRLDVDALIDKIIEVFPEADVLQEHRALYNETHRAFLKAHANELYVVFSLADLPRRPPYCIISSNANLDTLPAAIPLSDAAVVLKPLRGAFFLGMPDTFERLSASEPVTRPQMADAFGAADDAAIQVLVLPSDNDRRVVQEIMPTLPQEIGGGPSSILTRGVGWLAVALEPPPKISLQVTIQSEDNAAAEALAAKWRDMAQFLSRTYGTENTLQNVGKAVELLEPTVQGSQVTLHLDEQNGRFQALLDMLTPPVEQARDRARRVQGMNHLKQIGLAMHNFYDKNKRLPAIGTFDSTGKPLLGWRVHLLPFVDQRKLYEQFHLDEPWDSDHNRPLIARMPDVFRSPASKHRTQDGLATFRLLVGAHTVFPGREGIEFKQITDGMSNTIMAAEVSDEHAVIWSMPEGLPFDEDKPAAGLGGQFEGGFHCAFCDGSVRFIELSTKPETLRRLFLRDDGNPIEW